MERVGQHHTTKAFSKVSLVHPLNLGQVRAQRIDHRPRQHRRPVLLPLTPPHRNLPAIEIDVLHPQLQAFLKAKASPIEQHPDNPDGTVETRQHPPDFIATQYGRQANRLLRSDDVLNPTDRDVKNLFVQEKKSRQRLVLSRGADVTSGRKPGQERGNVGRAQSRRMRLAVKDDVPADPCEVGPFGSPAVMTRANRLADPVEQLGTLRLHPMTMPSSPPGPQGGRAQGNAEGSRPADASPRAALSRGAAKRTN